MNRPETALSSGLAKYSLIIIVAPIVQGNMISKQF